MRLSCAADRTRSDTGDGRYRRARLLLACAASLRVVDGGDGYHPTYMPTYAPSLGYRPTYEPTSLGTADNVFA